jgi:predicted GNAT family N-acyltransferase
MTISQIKENQTHTNEILEDPKTLSTEQLQALIGQLQTESALLTERLSVEDLQKLIKQNQLTAILDKDQNIIATAMLWEAPNQPNWYEMGTVWVSTEHRGQKLGHIVFEDITNKIPQGSSAFLLTTSDRIISSAKTFGYTGMEKDLFEENEFAIEPPAEPGHQLYIFKRPHPIKFSTKMQILRSNQ